MKVFRLGFGLACLLALPGLGVAALTLGPASAGPDALSGYTGRLKVIDAADRGKESWDLSSARDLPSALGGIEWKEKGDKPCEIDVYTKTLDRGKNPYGQFGLNLCDGNQASRKTVTFIDNPRYFVSGVQVCTTRKKDSSKNRLKGIRIFASQVSRDGEVTVVQGAKEEARRNHCDEPWHRKVECGPGEVAGALKVYYKHDDTIVGLGLRCQPVQVKRALDGMQRAKSPVHDLDAAHQQQTP